MSNLVLTKVALRYQALFLDISHEDINLRSDITPPVVAFVARMAEYGYSISEELLHALNMVSLEHLNEITSCIDDVMGLKLNWAPLVKGWNTPTGETRDDHFITLIANIFGEKVALKGTALPCGHLIPNGTFPLERYNGCPFCGTPFETDIFVYKGQASKLKELRLFTVADMKRVFESLLSSSTPLDGTQKDTLTLLMRVFPLPDLTNITMKETAMLVVKLLTEQDKADEATQLLKTPTDVLRYLWYEKTGHVQIIEPKTLVVHADKLYRHMWEPLDQSADAARCMKERLKLRYDRKACMRVARWLNAIPMTAHQAAENMNPKRGMWVRMIRALRLGEYSRKKGFGHLAEILDTFYKQDYVTWHGHLDKARKQNEVDTTLNMLKQRPGLFARCLFSTMLRFGSGRVLSAFEEVSEKVPARLLLSLGSAAESWFDILTPRLAHPITGVTHRLEPHPLLTLYDEPSRQKMAQAVANLYKSSMGRRFAVQRTTAKTIYIAPALQTIPVSVGDRSATIQDASCALMGTRFPVEGNAIRLFLQWGKGLPAQHLDMDLSCRITLPDNKIAECAYYNLTCVGAKHSGDIQSIPEQVGTAEYIELSLSELEAAHAQYVICTCNAYTTGALSPNLVVGWMDSAHPMTISETTGVAYDPSCVSHMVRISEGNLSKGLIFGVLDVPKREIVWLEMPFTAQNLRGADSASVEALLRRLAAKPTIGELLGIKAKAQGLRLVDNSDVADEVYTYEWALNPAEVTKVLEI